MGQYSNSRKSWSRIIVPSNGEFEPARGSDPLDGAWRTIQGIETVHMVPKGQVRWLPTGSIVEHVRFVEDLFGLQVAA